MPVAPLFVADMATLQARLRLSGLAASDGVAQLESVVLDVRQQFYRRLGSGLIATILATSAVDAPTTTAELRRTLADSVEEKWVLAELRRRMPVVFLDGGVGLHQNWQDTGAFHTGQNEREIDRLIAEVEEGINRLTGEIEDDEGGVNAAAIGPTVAQDLPGATLFPGLRRNPNKWVLP
jgi:hypothetical protein